MPPHDIPLLVGQNRYRLGTRLGGGSFGTVYACTDTITGQQLAAKLEPVDCKHPQLLYEAKLYRLLSDDRQTGIPNAFWFGVEGGYNIFVMERLGPSLEDIFTDIKPDNFMIGSGDNAGIVYLIDFGLAKRFWEATSSGMGGHHIRYKENKNLTGTARYASINTHLGIEQSRRDDLEALGYVLIYFMKGGLPWQGLQARTKQEKYSKITKSKLSHRVDSLCQGLPPEFADYLKRVRGLKFDEQPKYEELRGLMTAALVRSAHPSDEEHLDCKIMKNLQYQRDQFEREKRAGALTPPGYYR
ncbi:hypothetical protein FOL47_004890 [Perkinsus chesapeaki]|uniref:Casein kinase I n=1 Tax=Perkinsus chesapeaki TaxID=330153 RepID=A0A7J6M024_PERCH|nr:hypothetical protein FOL47_004890 [Perkinsus chesapeaki]